MGRRLFSGKAAVRAISMVLCLLPIAVVEGKLTILSESQRIQGMAGWEQQSESFDFSGSTSLGAVASGTGYYGEPVFTACTAGDFVVSASVSTSIFSGTGRAESTYTFTTDSPAVIFHMTGATGIYSWDGNTVGYQLRDLTLDEPLFSYASSTSEEYESIFVDQTYRIGMVPGHQYQLFMAAVVSQGDAGETRSHLTADIICVPAPGAVLLTAVGALLCCLFAGRLVLAA